jgi:CDP-diglyceride synthetase
MLKHRLLFGTLMIIVFVGLVLLDGRLDGSLGKHLPNAPVQATIFAVLIALLAIPAQLELRQPDQTDRGHLFISVTIPATILLAIAFYWSQYFDTHRPFTAWLLFVPAFSFLALFLAQALKFGTEGTIRNISASFFSIIYLGLFCMFILGIRILWGPWVLLFFVFAVKSSDIGAYAFGRLFGKHKLCPRISPGKTWEGLAGAAVVAAGVSFVFSHYCGIMPGLWAAAFGAVFGVLGQLGVGRVDDQTRRGEQGFVQRDTRLWRPAGCHRLAVGDRTGGWLVFFFLLG